MIGLSKKGIYWGIFALLMGLSMCLDYQDRGLYYSDVDSICCSANMDYLEVNIDVEGKEKKVIYTWGHTRCDSTIKSCAGRIFTPTNWMIVEQGDEPFKYKTQIPLVQEIKKVTDIFNRLKLMTARVRVDGNSEFQTKIDYEPYKCVVFGDGEVHHFANDSIHCKLDLKCNKLKSPVKQMDDLIE